jgi:hypothetical protein
MKNDWLIDLLEEEMERKLQRHRSSKPFLESDLNQELDELKKTKDQLKEYQVTLPSLREDYFDSFHDKVMAEVQNAKPLERNMEKHQKPWRTRALKFLIFLMILGMAQNKFVSSGEVLTQSVVSLGQQDLESARILLSHVDSFDYYMSTQRSSESGTSVEEALLGL